MGKRTAVALALALTGAVATAPAHAQGGADDAVYSLVHGCYALQQAGGGPSLTTAGPYRMQATTLGRYLLYGKAGNFLAATADGVRIASDASPDADFSVADTGNGTFSLTSQSGRRLAFGDGGAVTTTGASDEGPATRFALVPAQGCATFPEAEVDATGTPSTGPTPYGTVRGFIDAHMHMMGFEFLGGYVHCGRPWDAYGITHALAGCPRSEVASPPIEAFLSGDLTTPVHDPVGWPTFKDWPKPRTLTHEQSYYKWLERAWRGGLRVFVNLFVENHALCSLYPHRRNSCNEMTSVRLQHKDLLALQDYIDAQEGGPGKGWFRIVSDPFQARRVINAGKLAVVPGIEVSNLFDCGVKNDVAQCDDQQIDQRLDEAYNQLGVRDMELINKFDNGFGGVAGDNALTGVLVNTGNKLETGKFWQMQPCDGPSEQSDHPQLTVPVVGDRSILGNALQQLLPGGLLPVYQSGDQCNARALTPQGEHLVRRMMDKHMIIDPDHLDVISRKQLLNIVESKRYSGIISSHSWSTADAYPRIYKLGGMVTPYAGDSLSFVQQWRKLRTERDPRFYWGFGYGADMNGFGGQGEPRPGNEKNPVVYPFKSFDGAVTLDRQRTGQRVFDINKDGVAHYGLYPDWIEDLRKIAGDQIVTDMSRGPEAYLEMWERAVGVRASDDCRASHAQVKASGIGELRLGTAAEEVLRGAGQPVSRVDRTWRYCVDGKRSGAGRDTVVYTPAGTSGLVVSTAPRHALGRVARGARASAVPRTARTFGSGVRIRRAGRRAVVVYGVRGGKVRFTGVATRSVASSPKRLRSYLRLAGL